jgi:catechol 2,3-dioxygenase-like lactoylglutathione lyase family enzyme
LPRTGFIDHIGIGVPDLAAARRYYDELMPILGLKEWFKTGPDGPPNYGPDGAWGPQVFFYEVADASPYSRRASGLHHIAFMVQSRAIVREAHQWACQKGAVVLDEPREFPEYGAHYATYWLDLHGFKLEVVCHAAAEEA